VRFPGEGLIDIAYSVLRAILAALLILFGIGLIQRLFPNAFSDIVRFVEYVVQLSSDEHVARFVRDRLLVFGVLAVAFVLWVTHKWPTLIKTMGQALNPFARVGVATVSAAAAVLVALILAGPLGQSRSKGECESSFRLSLENVPSLVSNTKCGGGGRDSSH
jgi:flagellar biosynthesis protein FlhB